MQTVGRGQELFGVGIMSGSLIVSLMKAAGRAASAHSVGNGAYKKPPAGNHRGQGQRAFVKRQCIIADLQGESKMIENGMVLEADAYWDKVYEQPDHWADDRSYETVEKFGDDMDILYKAVAHWLDVDEEDEIEEDVDSSFKRETRKIREFFI